jgi:hypothetical protein
MPGAQSHTLASGVVSEPFVFTLTAPAALMELIVRSPLLLTCTEPVGASLRNVLTAVCNGASLLPTPAAPLA